MQEAATQDYKTRTIFTGRQNAIAKEYWPIGLDIGYSAVKVISPNMIACFPSYAIKEDPEELHIRLGEDSGYADYRNIRYKDENGVVWSVGEDAQDSISVSDTSAASNSIYTRNRYETPMFRVLICVGLAAALRKNAYGLPDGKKIAVTTGLPPKYMLLDQDVLKNAMKGRHKFQVMFVPGRWESFDFTLDERDIRVIDQPEGTLFSIATNAKLRRMPDAAKYMSSKMLIVDPGFGTLDCFPVIKGSVSRENCQTYPDFGMRQILQNTSNEIIRQHHFEIPVPAMQQYLEKGTVLSCTSRIRKKVPFADILNKCSTDVCSAAMTKIKNDYNLLLGEYDYLVITGGTGAAWMDQILNDADFKDSDIITILRGDQGDMTLPMLFSNVRGYFIYCLLTAGK